MNAILVNLNAVRISIRSLPGEERVRVARGHVKLLLASRFADLPLGDSDIPDGLVSDPAVERYLEIDPPIAAVMPEFQEIIDEIEYTYVAGLYFATVSAACVTIERLLNLARIELHPHELKIKELWGKGPLNEWSKNIEALATWGHIDATFADELNSLYKDVRCRYLHSQPIASLASDALRAVQAAFRLCRMFLGFPDDLFRITDGRFDCLNESDPRYKAFYAKHVEAEEA